MRCVINERTDEYVRDGDVIAATAYGEAALNWTRWVNVIKHKLLSQAAGHPISWFVRAMHSPLRKEEPEEPEEPEEEDDEEKKKKKKDRSDR